MTVDGTDFHVGGNNSKFHSHKFKKNALRYEVCVCIQTGDIVWINGPYEAGSWPDINIFRDGLRHFLDENERVEADDGYIGDSPKYIKCPAGFTNIKANERMQCFARRRHETINKRFKNWKILSTNFRHDLRRHGDVFRAVVVITQLAINNGEKPFQVKYDPFF